MRAGRIGVIVASCLIGWGATAAIASVPASACMISPGTNNCGPDSLTVGAGATQVGATQTGTVTTNPCTTSSCFTFTYTERVYRDPSNGVTAACIASQNCLDWVLQVSNSSGSIDTLEHVTISNFAGFVTDVGVDTTLAPGFTSAGTNSPATVDRNGSGSVLTWDFNTTSTEINPGQTSVLLEAETNATTTVPGTVAAIDGVSASGPALGPALPEGPIVGLFALIGGGLAGAFGMRRRRRR